MSLTTNEQGKSFRAIDIALIALFAAVMAVCSWISIPLTVPVTMQTFGVFISVGILGGKRGILAVIVWILLGAIGLPVFSGFNSGLGVVLGTTGGYIIGFIFSALAMWGSEKVFGTRAIPLIASMVVGLIIAYVFGTIWFCHVYVSDAGPVSFMAALGMCVFPFVLPDIGKIILAYVLTLRLKRFVPR